MSIPPRSEYPSKSELIDLCGRDYEIFGRGVGHLVRPLGCSVERDEGGKVGSEIDVYAAIVQEPFEKFHVGRT